MEDVVRAPAEKEDQSQSCSRQKDQSDSSIWLKDQSEGEEGVTGEASLADAVPLKSVGDASATIGAIHFGARIHNLLAISAFVLRGAEALRYKVVVLYHVSDWRRMKRVKRKRRRMKRGRSRWRMKRVRST